MKKLDCLLLGAGLLLISQNAHAYIDAGTGSYVIQIILAAAVGGIYTIKIYWKKLIGFFRSSSKDNDDVSEKY